MNASDWWDVRRLARAGVSQREIALRLGINRRTVAWLAAADEPPSEDPAHRGSQLDPLMPAIGAALAEQPGMQAPRMTELLRAEEGYGGSVDLVRRRLAEVRADNESAAAPAGAQAGGAVEWDWARMRQRPWVGGVRRSVWALVASLPFSGAQTAHFSLDATLESFLEGHVRVFEWLQGVPTAGMYAHLLPAVAKRDSRGALRWDQRFRALRSHYAFSSAAYRAPGGRRLTGDSHPRQTSSRRAGGRAPAIRGPARETRWRRRWSACTRASGRPSASKGWRIWTWCTRAGATRRPTPSAARRPAGGWWPSAWWKSARRCRRCRALTSTSRCAARPGSPPTAMCSMAPVSTRCRGNWQARTWSYTQPATWFGSRRGGCASQSTRAAIGRAFGCHGGRCEDVRRVAQAMS